MTTIKLRLGKYTSNVGPSKWQIEIFNSRANMIMEFDFLNDLEFSNFIEGKQALAELKRAWPDNISDRTGADKE